MELITITNGVIALVVIGLTQVSKKFIAKRFITLVPLVLGVVGVGFTAGWTVASVFTGLVIGLSAQGLYGQKQVVQG